MLVLDEIGTEHRGRKFAIIIDEAHANASGIAKKIIEHHLQEDAPGAWKMIISIYAENTPRPTGLTLRPFEAVWWVLA